MHHTLLCVARKFGPFVSPNLGTFYPFWPVLHSMEKRGLQEALNPRSN